MTRYTIPEYCNPLKQKGYIHYRSHSEKRKNCFIFALVAFGAGVAVCTLISEYSYLLGA